MRFKNTRFTRFNYLTVSSVNENGNNARTWQTRNTCVRRREPGNRRTRL